ncbi:MAG: hypothetical protein HY731_00540 [Candidatus Tectomicrobia bacterium]|nr:hypothetical protein [Candidatus Tectomicrobia bacterium]
MLSLKKESGELFGIKPEHGGKDESASCRTWSKTYWLQSSTCKPLIRRKWVVLRALAWCLRGCYFTWACRAVIEPLLRVELQEQLWDSFVMERLVLTGKLAPD